MPRASPSVQRSRYSVQSADLAPSDACDALGISRLRIWQLARGGDRPLPSLTNQLPPRHLACAKAIRVHIPGSAVTRAGPAVYRASNLTPMGDPFNCSSAPANHRHASDRGPVIKLFYTLRHHIRPPVGPPGCPTIDSCLTNCRVFSAVHIRNPATGSVCS